MPCLAATYSALFAEATRPIKEAAASMHIHELALNEESSTISAVGHGRLVVCEMKA